VTARAELYSEASLCDEPGMSTRELIEQEVARLPEPLQREVYDFAVFVRQRAQEQRFDGIALSASALAKDWDSPEEDQAWVNL
jgi:hypothetical protein